MEHDQEEEALFHSYPCPYYVQSPSAISHSNSADIRNTILESEFHSPTRPNPANRTLHEEASRSTLSRYSSSRGSSHSFQHQKRISFDARSNGTGTDNCKNRLVIVVKGGGCGNGGDDHGDNEDDEEEYCYGLENRSGWWKRNCSYRNSDSFAWIFLQISWRAVLSLCIALLVFYVATKPPPPKVSIQMAGIGQFGLGEGVDGSGVTTKFLTSNCSINLIIENKSKLFVLQQWKCASDGYLLHYHMDQSYMLRVGHQSSSYMLEQGISLCMVPEEAWTTCSSQGRVCRWCFV